MFCQTDILYAGIVYEFLMPHEEDQRLRKRFTEGKVIPILLMPPIPSRNKHPEKHARLVSMLFKPFRKFEDLHPDQLSWPQVLEELESRVAPDGPDADARVFRLIQNAEALGHRAAAHKT